MFAQKGLLTPGAVPYIALCSWPLLVVCRGPWRPWGWGNTLAGLCEWGVPRVKGCSPRDCRLSLLPHLSKHHYMPQGGGRGWVQEGPNWVVVTYCHKARVVRVRDLGYRTGLGVRAKV